MKKVITFIVLQLILSGSLMAQQSNFYNYDSLKQVLSVAKYDSSKVSILLSLCDVYKFSKPDSSLFYGYKALTLARKVGNDRAEVQALRDMGSAQFSIGNNAKGLQFTLQATKLSEEKNIVSEKGILYMILGAENRKNQNFTERLRLLKEAEYILDSLQDIGFAAVTRSYISNAFLEINELDSALTYAKEGYEMVSQTKLKWAEYRILLMLGKIEQAKGNYQAAIVHLRKAKALTRNATLGNFDTNFTIAKFFLKTNQVDSSIHYAQKSLVIARNADMYLRVTDASMMLSAIYAEKDIKKAYEYGLLAIAAKDSVYRLNQNIAIESLTSFDEQERNYEMYQAKTKYKSQVRLNVFIGCIFILMLIGFILYRNNHQKQKANRVLESTLHNLKSTQAQLIQSEKMASLGELTAGIAHEIQNPLNFVNNFSEVTQELVQEVRDEWKNTLRPGSESEDGIMEELLEDVEGNLRKIHHHGNRASSIVKGMLEHSRTSSGKKELTDINALADEYLRLAYHGLRAKDKDFNADFETHFDPNLPKIEVIPQDIGRVLLNLINNAFQACAERGRSTVSERSSDASTEPGRSAVKNQGEKVYKPLVSVATQLITNNELQITISDNGSGIPEAIKDKIFQPFFTTKPTGQGTGLGLSLAYDIVKAHGGELKVESLPAGRTGQKNISTKFIILLHC